MFAADVRFLPYFIDCAEMSDFRDISAQSMRYGNNAGHVREFSIIVSVAILP